MFSLTRHPLLIRLSFFALAVLIGAARVTDADLLDQELISDHAYRAITLDFATADTATGADQSLLFSITGLIPGGFRVASLRLNQRGEMPVPYTLSFANPAGSESFCQALQLRVLRNWSTIYSGALPAAAITGEITAEAADNLVLVLSLPAESTGLSGQSCGFALKAASDRSDPAIPFFDEELLQNQVTAG